MNAAMPGAALSLGSALAADSAVAFVVARHTVCKQIRSQP
jgi:hypothetical protein